MCTFGPSGPGFGAAGALSRRFPVVGNHISAVFNPKFEKKKKTSSKNTFVQKHFHPKTLSSKNTFIPKP